MYLRLLGGLLRPSRLSVFLFCFSAGPVLAESSDPVLDTVIVTAARTAQTAEASLAAVTVISREEIERSQATSVPDLLRGVPGLGIANNGGAGKTTSLFLRGTESDHVLVLIDGVKIGSATAGVSAIQDIPVELIERIEIVRGPRSSLYGSEAIGGVIQIFTRKGRGEITPYFSIGGGSFESYHTAAGVAGDVGQGWFSANVSATGTQGINSCGGQAAPGVSGCRNTEPDKDGYRNVSGSFRAGWRFDPGTEADVHLLRAKGKNEFDGSTVNESEFVQQVVGGRVRLTPAQNWKATLAAGQSRDESDNFLDDVFKSRFNTRRDTASWQNDISLDTDQLFTVGVDWQKDHINSTTAYPERTRTNKGAFSQYLGSWGAHEVQLSLRRDDNEFSGYYTTGGAAWGYTFTPDWRFMVSYGTAFKAPTFNELYFPGYGNPDLEAESSHSVEVGVNGKGAWGHASVHLFRTKVDDLIAFDAASFSPKNIDQARIHGLEAIWGKAFGLWELNTSLTLLDPENRAQGAYRGNLLPRRARQMVRIDLDRDWGQWKTGATLYGEGRRFDDLANQRRLPGYGTLDVRAEYRLSKAWRVQGRIANLFDKDYQTAAFYNQPGRSGWITLRYQP